MPNARVCVSVATTKRDSSNLGRALLGFISLGSLCAAPALRAQETSSPQSSPGARQPLVLEQVVVTAQKRTETLHDVPQSITAVTGAQLNDYNVTSAEELTGVVPGFVPVSSQPGLVQLQLRGVTVGQAQFSSTVGTYLDEIALGSSSAYALGSAIGPDFATLDAQRIEVLRGPQGALYGASTMGGLVKYVTNPPVIGEFSASVSAEGGLTDHADGANYGASGVVNVPLADQWALRAVGLYRSREAFIDNAITHSDTAGQERLAGGRLSVLYAPSSTFSVRLSSMLQSFKNDDAPQVEISRATRAPVYGDLVNGRTHPVSYDMDYQVHDITLNWDFGSASLVSATGYSRSDGTLVADLTPSFAATISALNPVFGGAAVPAADIGVQLPERATLDKLTEEIRITSKANQHFEWQGGLFYTDEDAFLSTNVQPFTLSGAALSPSLAPSALLFTSPSTFKEYAVFGDIDYYFMPQLDLKVAARYSHNKQDVVKDSAGTLANAHRPSSSSENVDTYSTSLRWRPTDALTLYALASSGYRPGGANSALPLVPPTFDADKLWNYEVGLKAIALDGRLSFNTSVFHIDWKDIQVQTVTPAGFSYITNGPPAKNRGIEWDLSYLPVRGLTILFNGAYTDAKLEGIAAPNGINALGNTDGERLANVPKWQANLMADYRFRVTERMNTRAGAAYHYVDDRTISYSQNAGLPNFTMPAYDTVDLRVGLESDKWTLTLSALNVTDERGLLLATTYPNGQTFATVTRPRTVTLDVRWDF
jgi:outer membrane receptor protein involved in Fe transport